MEIVDSTNIVKVGDKPIHIMPFGDIQFGTQDTNIDLVRKWVKYADQENAYLVGLGDYVDFMSPSNRERFAAANLYDNVIQSIDEFMMDQLEELYEILKPTTGRWLGLLHGHHYWTFSNGRTSDEVLAEMLGCPYLGTTAMLGLRFKDGICTIWATHGTGGGVTTAGHLAKLERIVATFDAHIYLMAHVTKLAAARPQRIVVNWRNGRVAFQNLLIASTGGFMQGYTPGRKQGNRPTGSYVEQKMLPPVGLGASLITVSPAIQHGIFAPEIKVEL